MDFDFKKFEKLAQDKWKEAEAFKFDNNANNPYYVLEQFPYPSGNIHMGHLRCYTIGDTIARFRRLQGYNVLHPFGFDAFGLPAENAAIDNGINPSIWTHKNIDKILGDVEKMGMSIDTDRIIKTCEPEYYKWEQKMFIDFFKNGIAYQKESIVNWDPVDHTVLANEQVIDGKGWRSGAVVEKKSMKQWYLKITEYADELLKCLDTALPEWPEKVRLMQKNWIDKSNTEDGQVMYKLRDWGISRQRYWGCPIPMVYCEKCGCVPENEENLPIKLPKDVEFDGKGNPLDKHPTWKFCKCPKCGGKATRETDTFDTFFESSWYFLRYLSPNDNNKPFNAKDVARIMPVQDYIGGIEHAILHLLYSRFFTKALADCGYFTEKDLKNLEPFRRLITQGMVLHEAFKDADGKWVEASKVVKKDGKYYIDNQEVFSQDVLKMSKSKKNVVSPIEIFEKYGADSARMFMLSDTPYEKEFEWTEAGIQSVYKYLQKIWRITEMAKEKNGIQNEAIIKEMYKFLNDYIGCLEKFEFNVAIAKLHSFTNILEKFDYNDRNNNYTLGVVMKNLSICISPICPHLSEAMWQQLGGDGLCCQQKLPEIDKKYLEENTMQVSITINGKFKMSIDVDKNLSNEDIENLILKKIQCK